MAFSVIGSLMLFQLLRSELRRRPGLGVIKASAAILLYSVSTVAMVSDVLTQRNFVGGDFKSFYYACRAAELRANFYDVEVLKNLAAADSLPGVWPFLYPPVFPYLFSYMARLSAPVAQLLWSLAGLAAVSSAVVLTVIGIRRNPEGRAWQHAASLAIGLSLALNLHNSFSLGQINVFVLLLITPALTRSGKLGNAACGALSLAILVKVTPLFLLLVLFAQRRVHSGLRVCAWLLFWIGLSLFLGAGPAFTQFLRFLPSMSYGHAVPGLFPAGIVYNFSVAGCFARITGGRESLTFLVTNLSVVALAAPVLYGAWRYRANRNDGVMLSACVVGIVAAPFAYVHHVILMLPALLQTTYVRGARSAGATVLALSIVSGADWPPLYDRLRLSPAALPWVSSLNLYGLLGLYLVGMFRVFKRPLLALD